MVDDLTNRLNKRFPGYVFTPILTSHSRKLIGYSVFKENEQEPLLTIGFPKENGNASGEITISYAHRIGPGRRDDLVLSKMEQLLRELG
jgi:hypothetical protein